MISPSAHRLVRRLALSAIFSCAIAACKNNAIDDSKQNTTNNGANGVVGPQGGIVMGPDGTSVRIAAGTLQTDTQITIVKVTGTSYPPLPGTYATVGSVYVIQPLDLKLLSPAVVTLTYPETLPGITALAAPANGTWQAVQGTDFAGAIEVPVTRFEFLTLATASSGQGGSAQGGSNQNGGTGANGNSFGQGGSSAAAGNGNSFGQGGSSAAAGSGNSFGQGGSSAAAGSGASSASGGSAGSSSPAPDCQAPANALSNGACFMMGTSTCNPVTNTGCAMGEACDLGQGAFQCFPAPNDAILCGACDNASGPYCAGTLHCLGSKCARYCCTSQDCGASGTCDTSQSQDGVGLCVAP